MCRLNTPSALLLCACIGACTYDWTVPAAGEGGAPSNSGASTSGGGVGGHGGIETAGAGGVGGVGGADPCAPDATDDNCTACIKTSCCPALTACLGDSNCQCWLDCYVNGGDCSGMCGAPNAASQQLFTCGGLNCSASCM
jgi:hypothetical protein